MGRPKKTEAPEVDASEVNEQPAEHPAPEIEGQPEAGKSVEAIEEPLKSEAKSQENLPANVIAAMRLYPQYEEIWITPRGFVHPVGVPQYLLKGAKLYKNKFYNN